MKIVALAGGVGGAKLVDGLVQTIPPEDITIVVNTGDDFEHLGLTICPDLDTVCYTLAGLSNPDTGWGRKEDTFNFLENMRMLGGPSWFRIGDADLATHIERTRLLGEGKSISQITHHFCESWGVPYRILPMSNQPVRTKVNTIDQGELPFQEYFVHQKCEPEVTGFRFVGAESADPAPGVIDAIESANAVVICPSNPWVSIDPILSVRDIKPILKGKIVVAVSPIIGQKAVKGPAAKMYSEMGIEPSALAVASHYKGILSGFIFDNVDEGTKANFRIPIRTTETLMRTRYDRLRLARDVLNLIQALVDHVQ